MSHALPPLPKPLASNPAGEHSPETLQALAIAQDKYEKAYREAKDKALPGALELLQRSGTLRPTTTIADSDVLMSNYGPRPIRFLQGSRAWLLGSDGGTYLDFLSGLAVTNLGHCHPAVTKAVTDQVQKLVHVSNLFGTEPHLKVAQLLQEFAGWDDAKTFYCNSGAEANEAALKLAKQYGSSQNPNKINTVSLSEGFHGRTMGALRITANQDYSRPFEPLGTWNTIVDRDDPQALADAVNENTCAIILETIQGEAGVLPVSQLMLATARQLCDQYDALLIIDEVQTGIGRTGSWFSWQQTDVVPDVMTLAKGLANGLPIGAVVAHGKAAEVFQPGNHGSTFGGNPVVAAAALAVLETIRDDQLLGQCRDRSQQLIDSITNKNIIGVTQVRGKGLLIGIELDRPIGKKVVNVALHNNLIINSPRLTTLRLAPPLIITPQEIDEAVERLAASITTVYERQLAKDENDPEE